MAQFPFAVIARVIYIQSLWHIHSQYTQIWYSSMTSSSSWSSSSSSMVSFDYDSTGCFSGTCCKTDAQDGVDAYVYRTTNVAAYSSLEVQFDVSANSMDSGDTCKVYYAYNSGSKKLIKTFDPPDTD
eukprot:362333_1